MKKLLYITANTKPEHLSASKTVARQLVDTLVSKGESVKVEELDLYATHLPALKHYYFQSRSTLIGADQISDLAPEEQEDLAQVNRLCDQFVDADWYVLAAPMWSLSYPAVVKQYLDCILMSGKTIAFKKEKPYGLLGDRPRSFVYVQSSGTALPWMLRPVLNKGMNYVEEIVRFIGMENTHSLFVDGTGTTEMERQEAIHKAMDKINDLAEQIIGE